MVAAVERKKAAMKISLTEASRIMRALNGEINGNPSIFGYTCSDAWTSACFAAVASGKVRCKRIRAITRDLHRSAFYPPGGKDTLMIETDTMRFMPPDITGTPLDQREDGLSFLEGIRLPSSSSAIMIDRIRQIRAKHSR